LQPDPGLTNLLIEALVVGQATGAAAPVPGFTNASAGAAPANWYLFAGAQNVGGIGGVFRHQLAGTGPTCGDGIAQSGEHCDPPGVQSTCAAGEICSDDCTACEAQPSAQLLHGTKLLIRDQAETTRRRVVFSSTASISIGPPGSAGDPRCTGSGGGGGQFRLASSGSGEDTGSIGLPCANWSLIGNESNPKGYKYRDPEQNQGPCKTVTVKAGRNAKVLCSGKNAFHPVPFDLAEGITQDPVSVRLTVGTTQTYCALFGGEISRRGDDGNVFRAKRALPPPACEP
jgi:hypothetical protein